MPVVVLWSPPLLTILCRPGWPASDAAPQPPLWCRPSPRLVQPRTSPLPPSSPQSLVSRLALSPSCQYPVFTGRRTGKAQRLGRYNFSSFSGDQRWRVRKLRCRAEIDRRQVLGATMPRCHDATMPHHWRQQHSLYNSTSALFSMSRPCTSLSFIFQQCARA